ncbi:glutamate receptor 4-like [Gigantopelta aegis]|uniref:glutamate receptor 4-like n=1 Tax=Gigantopelta aegis TaxID=1735272 RepID=UPI001B889602|nr:glutamate receptor 4-like [Gigantopelta aegis]
MAMDIRHMTLRVTTVVTSPFVIEKDTDVYEGFMVDLLKLVADQANFDYVIQRVRDGLYGSQRRDGSWNGMIGELVRGEADVAMGDLTVSTERASVVDFTKPVRNLGIQLLVKNPAYGSPESFPFTNPFSSELCLSIAAACILVCVVMYVIGRFSPSERSSPGSSLDRGTGTDRHFGLSNSIVFTFSTMTLQGYKHMPRCIAGRLLAAFWFLFVLFIAIVFTANTTVFLLAGGSRAETNPGMPFRDYTDLVRDTDISVGAIAGGSTINHLKRSNIGVYKRLYSRLVPVNDYAEGIERVRQSDNFVMLMSSNTAEYIAAMHCDVKVYGPLIFPGAIAFALKKGSRVAHTFNTALLELHESGTIQQLYHKWWVENAICSPEEMRYKAKSHGISGSVISLPDLKGAFAMLLAGGLASLAALGLELAYDRFKRKRSSKGQSAADKKDIDETADNAL